jgi:hypothetical protein
MCNFFYWFVQNWSYQICINIWLVLFSLFYKYLSIQLTQNNSKKLFLPENISKKF